MTDKKYINMKYIVHGSNSQKLSVNLLNLERSVETYATFQPATRGKFGKM